MSETSTTATLAKIPSNADSARPTGMRWVIVGIIFLTVIAGFFDRISISVLFSNTEFQDAMGTGFNPALLGLLMTSFLLAYGVSGILLSFLTDVYGPRRTLITGVALWGVFMALMGGAGSFSTMLVYRVMLGLAEGPQFGIANSLVKRWFASGERARANAFWTVGSPLGSAIGFPLTIWLVTTHGWRASFYALAIINLLIVLPLVLLFIRDQPPYSLPKEEQSTTSQLSYRNSIAYFVRDYRFWLVVVFACGALVYLWGVNSWLPTYLVKARNFDPRQTSIYASLPFILVFVGQFAGAYISDLLGRRAVVMSAGLFLAGALMVIIPSMPNAQYAAVMMALSGFFWGAAIPVQMALLVEILPAQCVGAGIGIANGIGNLVGAFAPLAMGVIISRTGSFDAGFLVLVGAAIVGSLALIPLMKSH